MEALLLTDFSFIAPTANAIVDLQTPPIASVILNYRINQQPNNLTPLSVFEYSYQYAKVQIIQRWLPLRIIFNAASRVRCVFTFGQYQVHTANFRCEPPEQRLLIFQQIMDSKQESFDINNFRTAPFITVNLDFHLEVEPPIPEEIPFEAPPDQPRRRPRIPRRPLPWAHYPETRSRREQLQQIVTRSMTRNRGNPQGFRFLGGKYEEIKNRMFHPGSLEDYYLHTKSVLYVPELPEKICFPMAFMKSQTRAIINNNVHENIHQTLVFPKHDFPENTIIPTDFVFLTGDSVTITVFSETKIQTGTVGNRPYYGKTSDEYNQCWMWCSARIHLYVMEELNQDVDYELEEEVCEAYSKIFKVNIHLYEMHGSGKRYHSYCDPNFLAHIHMGIDAQHHCYAITHIRSFFQKYTGSGRMSLHNFCDYCGYVTNDSVNKAKMMQHISKCQESNPECKPRNMIQFEQDIVPVDQIRDMIQEYKEFCCTLCGTARKRKKCCVEENHHGYYQVQYQCQICHQTSLSQSDFIFHECMIQKPKIPDPISNDLLWVFDVEAMQYSVQNQINHMDIYAHQMILCCLRNMYTEEKYEYFSRDQFVQDLIDNPRFDHGVFLAHNGGGYDHQYVLQYLELHDVPHTTVPSAGSIHKMLSLEFTGHGNHPRRLIDFHAFVSGSLRYIGESFQLPVAKGDFPHLFSSQDHLEYEGPLPALEYYGLERVRSEKEKEKFLEWYQAEQIKVGNHWNFKEELKKYCWLDVEVLSEACKKYRAELMEVDYIPDRQWNYVGVDPFALLTQAQIAMTIFLNGSDMEIFNTQFMPNENYKAALWMYDSMESMGQNQNVKYQMNSLRRPYFHCIRDFVTGYDPLHHTIYIFHDCRKSKCPQCFPNEFSVEEVRIAQEQIKWKVKTLQGWHQAYTVVTIWEHEFDQYYGPCNEELMHSFTPIQDREFFFGGRTEVFQSYCNPKEDETIKYLDVCSLYPHVCANCDLPVGKPTIIHLPALWNPNWFGYAKIKVECNPHDRLGLLPTKDVETHRLEFTLYPKVGVWSTEEINLAIAQGYRIRKIYMVYDFKRSKDLFRGYVQYFFQQKQEAEGWKKNGASSETPSEEEIQQVVDHMYEENNQLVRIRPEKVQKNPCKRHIKKIFLNTIWGKFCQSKQEDFYVYIVSADQYRQIINHPLVDKENIWFRHIQGDFFKCRYRKLKDFQLNGNRYNIFLSAMVTAQARCILHRKMLEVGPESILYCDTDSIIIKRKRDQLEGLTGQGLGKWVDEYPDKEISRFYGLAPKCYWVHFEDETKMMKTKGVILTLENQQRITIEAVENMLRGMFELGKEETEGVMLKHFSIFSNSHYTEFAYATLFSLYTDKVLRLVLMKRMPVRIENIVFDASCDLVLVPKGWENEI